MADDEPEAVLAALIAAHEATVGELRRRAEVAEETATAMASKLAEAEALARRFQAEVTEQRSRADRAEGEGIALREALARDARSHEKAEADRLKAETQRDAAQNARNEAQADLAAWTSGGPIARAWRAFVNRRGRP